MADAYDPYRRAKDVGADSPGEEEAQEQRRTGESGGPQEARPEDGKPKSPSQTSGRRSARHEQKPEVRKHFTEEERPSAQGEGEPSPESLKKRPSQQGIEPKSGSHGAHTQDAEEEAQRGPPDDEHARHGRQHVPGDRPGHHES